MAFGGNTLRFSDYLSSRISFLGVIAASPYNRVEFDVVSAFRTLFQAENVSFVGVPEPASVGMTIEWYASRLSIAVNPSLPRLTN